MTPHRFIAKWQNVELKERSASQAHFLDLCRLLDLDDPVTADPKGDWFTFEKGASKTTGGEGWADVWRKECFAWEYKGRRKDLKAAFAQLQQYAIALENPPLLIVSDMDRIQIHTNWTNTIQQVHEIGLTELADAAKRDLLRAAFTDPERLRPTKTRQALTEEAARRFAALAMNLRQRGHDAQSVAHFVNRLIFCMFAEDVNLLPNRMFQRMIEGAQRDPAMFELDAGTLFKAMQSGGRVGFEHVEWFNGGLFDHADALPLDATDIKELLAAARLDWSEIDPSIMGTLFERGLDPDKRSQLGAHYTDRDKIMQIVEPVIIRPLLAEWDAVRASITEALDKAQGAKSPAARTRAAKQAEALKDAFLERLANFRVLDPACGSGNFLYLSLLALKDTEHRINLDAEAMGLPRGFPRVGPECVYGIELNPYAAELARVSVWIGEIQWMRRNGFEAARNPILRPLANIENRDALLNADGSRSIWPNADVVIGNPPFLGSKFLRSGKPATRTRAAQSGLGDNYVNKLFAAYSGENPGSADLVTYWLAQSDSQIERAGIKKIGFVATKSIAKGASNQSLSKLLLRRRMRITFSVSNTEWVVDGADVRVCLIVLEDDAVSAQAELDGRNVPRINSDLTSGTDVGSAKKLRQNLLTCFQGVKQNGTFTLGASGARKMISAPLNPNGLGNSHVVKRFFGNDDVSMRDQDGWIIDFSEHQSEGEASLFEQPFEAISIVKTERAARFKGEATEKAKLENHWIMQRSRPELRKIKAKFSRVLGIPETSEHFILRWLPVTGVYSGSLFIFPRDDDVFFGVLQSRIHILWARRSGNNLGAGNQDRYNKSVTFETFPFPQGLTPDIPASNYAADPRARAIAKAAARLNDLRENWLNPSDLVRRVPEVVPGYPDRILPVDDTAERELKKRTLTNLYNARPAWLAHAHADLDAAVADAYGWGDDWRAGLLTDDEILARLFRLNEDRAASQ